MTEPNITYVIQTKWSDDEQWTNSLAYDKPYTSKSEAIKVMKKARKNNVASQYRIVQQIPLED